MSISMTIYHVFNIFIVKACSQSHFTSELVNVQVLWVCHAGQIYITLSLVDYQAYAF